MLNILLTNKKDVEISAFSFFFFICYNKKFLPSDTSYTESEISFYRLSDVILTRGSLSVVVIPTVSKVSFGV